MQEYIDLLRDLMACRSVTRDVAAVNKAQATIRAFLEKKGIACSVENIDGRDVVYATTGSGKISDVLFNAHLDVVPPNRPEDHILKIEGSKMIGRGSCDCLGHAISIAKILIDLKGKADVSAFFSSDEETGGLTTLGMAQRGYGARKIALAVDSSAFSVAIAQKGILVLKITAKGKGGHSSTPWALDNPIDKLFDAYARFRAAWPWHPCAENQWLNSMTPCIIQGGNAENQIPDTAEMTINIRYTANEDADTILKLARESTGLDVEVARSCAPLYSDESSPAILNLKDAIQAAFPDRNVVFRRMNGATDARHLGSLNVPVAIIGTLGGGAHSANEWFDIENAKQYIVLLENYILNL